MNNRPHNFSLSDRAYPNNFMYQNRCQLEPFCIAGNRRSELGSKRSSEANRGEISCLMDSVTRQLQK